ncbi:triose-phosphate isomerase family protein [Mycoplasma sp. 744]|uniref:triose-phosphate isomerase family protein n=1 Tax=Mycoplasma sp. 744 TaxID=3108531 RepID=UPI002B1D1EBF|nr:triose-phosphate isomerase family protein [Mycoplasma sp. 744]MEA4115577.1 triose-phosphate isomerase family protein [Mycoplasma sp. 744]
MKKMLMLANWKNNLDYLETKKFIKEFNNLIETNSYKKSYENIFKAYEIIIAPSYIGLGILYEEQNKYWKIGAQNLSLYKKGPFTGEISAEILNKLNVKYVILGHSERRRFNFENNYDIYLKAKLALENNITPIICVGENSIEYQKGITKEIIIKQLEETIKDLDKSQIIISYEPIWAIGNIAADAQVANDVCKFIKKWSKNQSKVLYGGSVNKISIAKLVNAEHIEGFLIGNASLDPQSFFDLITYKLNN